MTTLSRHIYENYLHCIFAINRPEMLDHLIDTVVGLKTGSHEYAKTNSGKTDARKIVRKSDGATFAGQISAYKMAESSPHRNDLLLFDYIYSFLSEYTHPSFTSLRLVMQENGGLDPLSNELKSEALFFSICFSAMILDQLRRLNCIGTEAKNDIKTVTRRIGKKANLLLHALYLESDIPAHFSPLVDRISELGE